MMEQFTIQDPGPFFLSNFKKFRLTDHKSVVKATVLLVLCVIVLTNLGVELIFCLNGFSNGEVYRIAHTAATVMPLLIAFPTIYFIFRLLWKLNESHLIIKALSRTDGLTNVSNRRYFEELGARGISLAKRIGNPVSLLMLDLDHFKSINDRHGHTAGDGVLVAFAERLRQTLRITDIVGRYGGEEFVVLLPASDSSQAFEAAQRIRLAACETPVLTEGQRIRFTVSIGVMTSLNGSYDLHSLIKCADKALFQAKGKGRNRVEVSEEGGRETPLTY
ncbi:MAG: GGDEF domain-containing protein [Desulfobacteraceae bacterium]|nr:GGDEF domain-containing protein [Desulfobacteraceae bacterium]